MVPCAGLRRSVEYVRPRPSTMLHEEQQLGENCGADARADPVNNTADQNATARGLVRVGGIPDGSELSD